MWLLPSRERPDNLKRFFKAYHDTKATTPGLLVLNEGDFSDTLIALPPNWECVHVKASCTGEAMRAASAPLIDKCEWLGVIADSAVPETPEWDKRMIQRLNGWNFVSCNDGWRAPRRAGPAVMFSGDWLRAVGCMYPDGFNHLYVDDVWEMLGRETSSWLCAMEIMVRHEHHWKGRAPADETFKRDNDPKNYEHDHAAFVTWQQNDKAAIVARILALQKSKGALTLQQPDFTGVKVMVLTPCADAKPEQLYQQCLFNTMATLKNMGVPVSVVYEVGNADISLARAKLFSAFLRNPDYTHALWIDDDMGWDDNAVMRLFAARKDFVAVAGPKKYFNPDGSLTFAANYADDKGEPLTLMMETASGAAEIYQVGLAFALISKACAEKMARSFPELNFESAPGMSDYAVFAPFVRNRRYYAEDFSFCQRWLDIGGRTWICPDIRLKHVGRFVFEGSVAEHSQQIKDSSQLYKAAE